MLPAEIEAKSMEIIKQELTQRHIQLPQDCASVILRAIHTTADFDYAEHMKFSPDVCAQTVHLMRTSRPVIITDTNMALAGINKNACAQLGIITHCYMADIDIAETSKKTGTTRAEAAADKMAALYANTSEQVICACGNAPTALLRLCNLIQQQRFLPALVIGVPVGFVHVKEAKQELMKCAVPFITMPGRKGGSTVAAAICNALLYEAVRQNTVNKE